MGDFAVTSRPAAARARQPKAGEKPWTGRARPAAAGSDVAGGLTAICCCARRSWIPTRCEGILEANGVFLVLNQGRLWASGTIPRPRDEAAIPPSRGPEAAGAVGGF